MDNLAEESLTSKGWEGMVNEYFEKLATDKEIVKRQEAYFSFAEKYSKRNKNLVKCNSLFQTYVINAPGARLAILCLNSAAIAHGGSDDNGKLAVSTQQIKAAFDSVKKNYNHIILAMHHPSDWLQESDREEFNEFLHEKVDLFLCGHMHKYIPGSSERHGDIVIKIQTGAFDSQQVSAGYSVITLDHANKIDTGRVHYRQWSGNEGAGFTKWENRGRKGEEIFSASTIRFDIDRFSKEAKRIVQEIDAELLVNLNRSAESKLRLIDIFDKPILTKGLKLSAKAILAKPETIDPVKPKDIPKVNEGESDRLKKISGWEHVEFDDLTKQGKSYIVSGSDQQGKTAAINYLFSLGLLQIQAKNIERIVLKANFKDVLPGKLQLALVEPFEPLAELRGVFTPKIKTMLEAGSCLVLIDDFDPIKENKHHILREFIKQFPANDFIVAVKEAVVNDVLTEMEAFNEAKEFQFLRISSLKRKNIRALCDKIYRASESEKDVAFRIVTNAVKTSKLPSNHFIYTMLLEIYSSKHSLENIFTETDIVENFVEVLLSKHRMAQQKKEQPRYADILQYLGYVALKFTRREAKLATRNELLVFANEFNDICNFSYDMNDYIEISTKSGILVFIENSATGISVATFAQKCFQDYVAARYIQPGDDHERYIFTQEGMARNDKIVEYYCARSKSPRLVIDKVIENLRRVKTLARNHIEEKYGQENASKRIKDLLEGQALISLMEAGYKYLPNHDDIVCDKVKNDEDHDKMDEDVKRAEFIIGEYSIFSAYEVVLSLLARTIKSSPHLRDPQYQIQVYRDTLKEYHEFMGTAMLVVEREMWPEMQEMIYKYFGEVGVDEVDRKSFLQKAEGFLGIVMAFVPRLVQKGIALDLGAISHESILGKIASLGDIAEEEMVMIHFLRCDLELGNYVNELEPLVQSSKTYVQISLYLKVCELLRGDHSLTDPQRTKLKNYAKSCGRSAIVAQAINVLVLAQERVLSAERIE